MRLLPVISAVAAASGLTHSNSVVTETFALRQQFDTLASKLTVSLTEGELSEYFGHFVRLAAEGKYTSVVEMFQDARPAILESEVAKQNQRDGSFRASLSERFRGKSLAEVKSLMGFADPREVELPPVAPSLRDAARKMMGLTDATAEDDDDKEDVPEELPENFNLLEAHPLCAGVIGHTRDQSHCGGCWAFAGTETFNDRLCIASKGQFTQLLSVEDTVSCANGLLWRSEGCKGGYPHMAWLYFMVRGIPSGGDYQDGSDTCQNYSIEPCKGSEHSTEERCKERAPTPTCTRSCTNPAYGVPFKEDLHFSKGYYLIRGVDEMMRQIMVKGSVAVGFPAYLDLISYKEGIYAPNLDDPENRQLGGHAVKLIGWGRDPVSKEWYWLGVNSWGVDWGMQGHFKFKMEATGVEDYVTAGDVMEYVPRPEPTPEPTSVLRF